MVGILALQGDFDLHEQRIRSLGRSTLLVRNVQELEQVSALVLPGGESTAFLRLCLPELRSALRERIAEGMPTLATCAGVIFLAKRVENPAQESLEVLDITVCRNAYGRQLDSFIDHSLNWTTAGRAALVTVNPALADRAAGRTFEGVFIRAPKITHTGTDVEILVERGLEPVLIREKNVFAATFHPELSDESTAVHELFLAHAHA